MSLAAVISLTDQDVRGVSSTSGGVALGQRAVTADGRAYRYGLNGNATTTALAPGKLMQGATAVAGHTNKTGTTYVAGVSQVTLTVSATAVTLNQYQGGYFVVNAGTGAGQALLIAGNSAATSTGSPIVNLAESIITATLASDSKFSLVPHPYSAAIIASQAASTAVLPVGVPAISVPAANYAWFQTEGPASVVANGTPTIGLGLIPSATTDGALDVEGTSAIQPRVGYAMITAVTTEYKQVWLTING